MRVPSASLTGFVERVLRAGGVDEAQVRSVSANLIWNDLAGRRNHGVERLPILMERVRRGAIRCPCALRFESLTASMEVVDGGDGFGQHVGAAAIARACELAGAQGVGVVGAKRSQFFGTGAYYLHQAALQGM
ncbi:MAG: Ldh family oxidoreductase, partial [Caulobacterales bacterium]|nr:Ldh family oxidoreductase [Caulobacterales bacterium]